MANKDKRCPKCRASEDKRVLSTGFGPKVWACNECGYEFPPEENE